PREALNHKAIVGATHLLAALAASRTSGQADCTLRLLQGRQRFFYLSDPVALRNSTVLRHARLALRCEASSLSPCSTSPLNVRFRPEADIGTQLFLAAVRLRKIKRDRQKYSRCRSQYGSI